MFNPPSRIRRFLSVFHRLLGILILPWVILIGLSGIYLNHAMVLQDYLPYQGQSEAGFDTWPNPNVVNLEGAKVVATRVYGSTPFSESNMDKYHGRDVWWFKSKEGTDVIVVKNTGHYWVKTGFTRVTFDPDGRQIDKKVYFMNLARFLHSHGWYDRSLGRWLTDITGVLIVYFGLASLFGIGRGPRTPYPMPQPPTDRNSDSESRTSTPRPRRIKLD